MNYFRRQKKAQRERQREQKRWENSQYSGHLEKEILRRETTRKRDRRNEEAIMRERRRRRVESKTVKANLPLHDSEWPLYGCCVLCRK